MRQDLSEEAFNQTSSFGRNDSRGRNKSRRSIQPNELVWKVLSQLSITEGGSRIVGDTKYSQNWMKQKPKSLITLHEDRVQRRAGGGPEASHTILWHGPPWPCHQGVWPPGPPPDIALPPMYSPRRENPKGPNSFPENILQAAGIIDVRSGGSRSSSRHLEERGITIGGLLHHHACLQSDVWAVYLGLRVHSSS
jgi:hypothetical protein